MRPGIWYQAFGVGDVDFSYSYISGIQSLLFLFFIFIYFYLFYCTIKGNSNGCLFMFLTEAFWRTNRRLLYVSIYRPLLNITRSYIFARIFYFIL